jgi:cytidine deaminase
MTPRRTPAVRNPSKRPASARRRAAPEGVALMAAADRARRRAYAPYSEFPVGAAILLRDGRIVTGCNVENASYGLAVCAERNAVFKAVSEGDRDFVAVAVTAREGRGAPPCGSCRQVLHEFAPDILVYWRDARRRIVRRKLGVLLAMPFDLKMLKGKG